MNHPDPLHPISELAEHLDSVGRHPAALAVRDVLSSLRAGGSPDPQVTALVRFTARMISESAANLDQLRELAGKRITAEQCQEAASGGGEAVAELVDVAFAYAASVTGPRLHTRCAWPATGEYVMTVRVLAELGDMTAAEIKVNTGVVRQIYTGRRRAQVKWSTHTRWLSFDDIVGVRFWRTAEDSR
jgi:hypothetical protein